MKKLIFLLAIISLLTACGKTETNSDINPELSKDTTQSEQQDESSYQLTFTAQTFEGEDVDQTVFEKTKLTMVNVWATFCPPCIEEMPDLGKLAAEGGEEFQIIGICADLDGTDEKFAEAKEIVSTTQANYMHLQPSESLLPILTASSAVPVTFFFDSQGQLVGKGIAGAKDYETWNSIITERLALAEAQISSQDDATPSGEEASSNES